MNKLGCPECVPEMTHTGERLGEHHFSVRFGDHTRLIEVVFAGVVVMNVIECVAGPGGWAHVVVTDDMPKAHACPCGANAPLQHLFDSDDYSVRVKRRHDE